MHPRRWPQTKAIFFAGTLPFSGASFAAQDPMRLALKDSESCLSRLISRPFSESRLKPGELEAYLYLKSLPEGAILRVTPPQGIPQMRARFLGVSHSYHEHVELLQHQDVAFVLFRQIGPNGEPQPGTYMTALKQIAPPGGGATKTIVEILN